MTVDGDKEEGTKFTENNRCKAGRSGFGERPVDEEDIEILCSISDYGIRNRKGRPEAALSRRRCHYSAGACSGSQKAMLFLTVAGTPYNGLSLLANQKTVSVSNAYVRAPCWRSG